MGVGVVGSGWGFWYYVMYCCGVCYLGVGVNLSSVSAMKIILERDVNVTRKSWVNDFKSKYPEGLLYDVGGEISMF